MKIWVDADACPKPIKEILWKAAIRTETTVIFVANQGLTLPRSVFIQRVQVGAGFDVADEYIATALSAGDLVITADIPLAVAVITRGGMALNPRGELYTKDTIKSRLMIRNIHDHLRNTGELRGGPPALAKKELVEFSNHLDRLLTRSKRNL